MQFVSIVKNLQLKVGDKILQPPLSFVWKKGEQWCVTGASGSGKTVFLKMMAGLLFSGKDAISYPILETLKTENNQQQTLSDFIAFVPQEIKIS